MEHNNWMFLKKTVFVFILISLIHVKSGCQQTYPYSTDNTHLTVWNGTEYVPFFLKGINLGVSVPGTQPGELAASKNDYIRWISQIKEAGFNCIRLYTLHYPRFYFVIDSINKANPQNPILFFQGVWLNEELEGYQNDLFFLTDTFKTEIAENIDCVHGKRTIPLRFGKAFGNFNTDASPWCLGYIIGREISPYEILRTDEQNLAIDHFNGSHFNIEKATASESWITAMLDYTVHYQHANYNTQRPVSASSWPTLDPIVHPEEENREEDTAVIDISKIEIVDAPAGFFVSYHAYPYYPDFISKQLSYQGFSDNYGPNSYQGYLKELKAHYTKHPLIIAEYGVPSSWAIAHYATSGMNHGGFDEYNQGLTNIRILETIRDANCGGGMQFEWIDEWFKRTWMTDPIDGSEDRHLWHNIAAAEQNYGLVSFNKTLHSDTIIEPDTTLDIRFVRSEVNYAFFEMELGLKNPLDIPDELWLTFDTYSDSLGELLLPGGDTIPHRAEFALRITNYDAKLYVTRAYDIFAIWHNISDSGQLYQSTPTEGAPWQIVRVKNNYFHSDVQYIGDLKTNYAFQNPSSKDAVVIDEDKIMVRLPWSYLNVVAPNKMKVLHDNKLTSLREDTITQGIKVAVLYKNKWRYNNNRFTWNNWTNVKENGYTEQFKTSFYVMKNRLHDFNTAAVAVKDSFKFYESIFPVYVDPYSGLLANDFDLDGDQMFCVLTENPANGSVMLNSNGSYTYSPNAGFTGYDSFKYSVYDGYTLSKPNSVVLYVNNNDSIDDSILSDEDLLIIYPNPASNDLNVAAKATISTIEIYLIDGHLMERFTVNSSTFNINVANYARGNYLIVTKIGDRVLSNQFVKE